MIDIQHDSPVPIHEQIMSQIMAHVATGALKAGARLAEYRAFAQQLLTNPQVVARAYADLEWEGVLVKRPAGEMEVAAGAALICRVRLQDKARQQLRQSATQARAAGLADEEIRKAIDETLTAAPLEPLSPEELQSAIKKLPHATRHRDSQGIQVLSRQEGAGPAEPDDPARGDLRAPGG